MINELHVLKTLKEITGTKAKITFLSNYSDNLLIRELLKTAFSPFITTNLAEKKMSRTVSLDIDSPIEFNENVPDASIFNLLAYVASDVCSGRDEDIYYVNKFLEHYSLEEAEILKQIVTKKLTIGMNIKNINKAINGFLTIVSPMLAFDFNKYLDTEKEYSVTLKLDGYRLLVKKENGELKGYSRSGIEEKNLSRFLQKLDLPDGYYYDGELLATGEASDSFDRFRATATILRKKMEVDPSLIRYNIFDMIKIDEFENDDCTMTYDERRKLLDSLKDNDFQCIIKPIMRTKINTELFNLLEKVVSDGEEGLMLNYVNGVYECKRSKNLLKMKLFKEADLMCVAVNEGRGKFAGTLGSIDVLYKGNIVSIPSFPDDMRNYYWNNPDAIVGKIVAVKYFQESVNKNGDFSLRLPSFKVVREDKSTESYE